MAEYDTYKGKLTGAQIDALPDKVTGLETRVLGAEESVDAIRAELDAKKRPYVVLMAAEDINMIVDDKIVKLPARTKALVPFENIFYISVSKKYVTYFDMHNFKPMGNRLQSYFQTMYFVEELDVSQIDVSECTSLSMVFYDCRHAMLKGLGTWDTSKVTDMDNMFNQNRSLLLSVEGWDTRNVTSMYAMFAYCSNIEYLDLSKWDTSKVTDMAGMFSSCQKLTELKLEGWDTRNVTNMSSMFNDCKSLTNLDTVGGFDTSKVTAMTNMFKGCTGLRKLDLSKWDVGKVRYFDNFLESCTNLTDIGDISGWDTSNMITFNSMFSNSGLKELAVDGWDVGNAVEMGSMLSQMKNITFINIRSWHPVKNKTCYYMFFNDTALKTVYCDKLVTQATTNLACMFYICTALTGVTMTEWDTRNVTEFSGMFSRCSALIGLDLGTWDTGSAESFREMFYGCTSLKTLNLSGWDGTNVENMNNMLYNCTVLTTLVLGEKFFKCGKISSIDFSTLQSWKNGSVQQSLVTDSYDRAANGLQQLTLKLHANTKAVLTDEDKAAMTAKGYIIA